MSLYYLPRELVKYITDFLDNQDYLSTLLASKVFHLSQIDKQARKEVETCVKYRKDEYLHLHSKEDILFYAYLHKQEDLLEKYSFSEYQEEIIIRAGDLEAFKKMFSKEYGKPKLTLICKYNQIHLLKYLCEDIYNGHLIPYDIHLATAYDHDHHEIIEYLSRFEELKPTKYDCTVKIDGLLFIHSNLLALTPARIKAHKVSIKQFLEIKINGVSDLSRYLSFNEHTIQNLEILQLSYHSLVKILERAMAKNRLNLVKYLVNEINYSPKIKSDFPPKTFFYLLDLDQNRSKKKIIEFLLKNPSQVIRLFNRFPNLKKIITNKVLIDLCEQKKVDRNLFYFLFHLRERKSDDILIDLLHCKDKEMCKFLFSELERHNKDFLNSILSNSSMSEERRHDICIKYLNCMSLSKLVELLKK